MQFPADLESFVRDFERGTLPKARWTHEAHLLMGLWYLSRHAPAEALAVMRARIRAYNDAVGTLNSDSGGYHETLTRLYLRGLAAHRDAAPGESLRESFARLLASPIAGRAWPLTFYSRERLFSVAARRDWIEPDLQPAP